MDVRLPDGTVIQNVPDGTTKADLVAKLKGNGMAVPSETGNAALKRVKSAPGVGTLPLMPEVAQPANNVIDFASLK